MRKLGLGVWAQYISGIGVLNVGLTILGTQQGRESGAPTSSYQVTTSNGTTIWGPSSLYELTTGQHVTGTSTDITIQIDPGYFKYLDLAPGLTYASQVPANEYNPIIVFMHEIMHGFGQVGWYSQSGTKPVGYESVFDSYISVSSSGQAYFTGDNAEAAYGGPVPLTTGSTAGENYYHVGSTLTDYTRSPSTVHDPLTLDLMNGIVLFFDYQYSVSALDLAILKDLGYTVLPGNEAAPVVSTATPNQTWQAGQKVSLKVPAGTFSDPQNQTLTFAAALSNGQPLPAWLAFDATSETFTGTVPTGTANFGITLTATDTSNLSVSETFSVTINQPPVSTVPGTLKVTSGTTAKISGISVADGDAVSANEALTVILSDKAGLLSATAPNGGSVSGAGTITLTLSGSLAQINAELATLTYLGSTTGKAITESIDVATSDGRGGSNDHHIAVTINPAIFNLSITSRTPGYKVLCVPHLSK